MTRRRPRRRRLRRTAFGAREGWAWIRLLAGLLLAAGGLWVLLLAESPRSPRPGEQTGSERQSGQFGPEEIDPASRRALDALLRAAEEGPSPDLGPAPADRPSQDAATPED